MGTNTPPPFTRPKPPEYYSSAAAAAWMRGYADRIEDESRQNPYRKRFMRIAWLNGWDAAKAERELRVNGTK